MPTPNKNESKQDFLSRCTKELIEKEGRKSDQAYAMCNSFWDKSKKHTAERSVLSLNAPMELRAKEGEKAGFLITAFTGKPFDTWFGTVAFDVKSMEMNNKAPILREHMRDRVVGWSTKTWTDENNLYVQGEFADATQDAQEVRALAEEGFPWQASVGIWPRKVKQLKTKDDVEIVNGHEVRGPGAEIWEKSFVREVSMVALGRDADTAAISLTDFGEKVPVEIYSDDPISGLVGPVEISSTAKQNKGGKKTMPITREQLDQEAPSLVEEIKNEARDDAKGDGVAQERKRVVEILEAGGDAKIALEAIKDGIKAEACFKMFFEAEKEKRVDALKQMGREAPQSLGQEEPPKPETEDNRRPDEILAEKATKLAREKGISYEEASRQVLASDPKLAEAVQKGLLPD